VVVRVVVRGTDGKPLEGLRKEDFNVFDRGKEQSIAQFEEEMPTPLPSTSAAASAPSQTAPPSPPAMPSNFVALYFDDLNTADLDMIYARDAADRYLAANLQVKDRVAIFASGQMLSDFSVDLRKIRATLANCKPTYTQ
jgi:VWFA-related protein